MQISRERDLLTWKDELEKQLADVESKLQPLLAQRAGLLAQIGHISALVGSDGSGSAAIPRGGTPSPQSPFLASSRAAFTPVEEYWVPILQSLVELGGRAPRDQVIDRVGEKMERILTAADRQLLPSGIETRWRNRVAWQRENMKRRGLLRNDSPRGIWEITEEGRVLAVALGAASKGVRTDKK